MDDKDHIAELVKNYVRAPNANPVIGVGLMAQMERKNTHPYVPPTHKEMIQLFSKNKLNDVDFEEIRYPISRKPRTKISWTNQT